ncbi:MAG: hypothetical protein A4E49_01846 [Methanosaeta sp. PtaU1.Bin112]|nr:MAG: hypothetical protein A4E49_01846 [Methanosaeta sp. PtaU1.Bin112]
MEVAEENTSEFEYIKSKVVDCPGIKIRENAIVSEDATARSTAVLELKKNGVHRLEANASIRQKMGG